MRKVASTITSRRAREGTVRALIGSDLPAAIRLLSANPIENVFVASRVRAAGIEQANSGRPVWGYERGGLLQAMCHAGSNLVPVNADEQALDAWTAFAGPDRMCASIIGSSHVALDLWSKLSERWGGAWSQVRDVRPHQPVMAISAPPAIPADRRLGRVTLDQWDAYTEAAADAVHRGDRRLTGAGQSRGIPLLRPPARFRRVARSASLTVTGCFSKPISAPCRARCARCREYGWNPSCVAWGLAAPAMAAVVQLARNLVPTVSLYVNDYNLPARSDLLRQAGFTEIGEFATNGHLPSYGCG